MVVVRRKGQRRSQAHARGRQYGWCDGSGRGRCARGAAEREHAVLRSVDGLEFLPALFHVHWCGRTNTNGQRLLCLLHSVCWHVVSDPLVLFY